MTNNLNFVKFKPTKNLKAFIKENKLKVKELIDQEDFTGLYHIALEYGDNKEINIMPDLTRLLYNINIDPLDYMDWVPASFLDSVKVEFDLILPENITAISDFAFAGSWIKSITIPTSCDYFGDRIFYDCKKLNYVYYNGTYDEFKKISKERKWRSDIDSSSPVWVKCVDGRYDIHDV